MFAKRDAQFVTGLLLLLAAPAASAQTGSFYPAVDLPLETKLQAATAGDDAGALTRSVSAHDDSALAPTGAAPVVGFDASHFTPSPSLAVRDLDGDGHLDGTWLHAGVHVWFGQGDGRFGDATFLPTIIGSTSPLDGQWADMNGDGRLDAVFLTFDQVEVVFDQGGGQFVSSLPQPLAGANDFSPNSWTVGYVNGDSIPDIVARNFHGYPGTELDILYGLGGASFGAPVKIATPQGFVEEVGLGDLNGDGLTDIVAEFELGQPFKLRSWTQTAAGTFQAHPAVNIEGPSSSRIEVRDMTGDGLTDVVVHEYELVALYIGNGTGVLPATSLVLTDVRDRALFVDMDGDGLVDVLQQEDEPPLGPSVVFARPDGTLSPPVVTRQRAAPLGAGDFDGDGVLDVFSPEVALRGRGDGSFEAPLNFELASHISFPRQVALADFNEDGVLDVVSNNGNNGVSATMSGVAANWGPPVSLSGTTPGTAIAHGDLNGDGHEDVVVSYYGAGGTAAWLGRGDGTFLAKASPWMGGDGNTGLGLGRFDATAPLDLAVAGDGQLRVRLGLGALEYGEIKAVALPAGSGDILLAVRDFDGDALDDVIVARASGVHVLRATGHGNFAAPVTLLAPVPQFANVSILDADGDGDDDVLVSGGFKLTALLGDGAGHFAPAPFDAVTSDRLVVGSAVADVNGDGLLDLALGHDQAWSLHLGLATGGWEQQPVDVFDLSGDGIVLHFADANVDGRPDLLAIGGEGTGYGSTDEVGLTLALHRAGPWADVGFALAGADGPPFLWPTGTLEAGAPIGLVLRDAPAGVIACFVLGLSANPVPFKGGVLVPDPLIVPPCPPSSPKGVVEVSGRWPAGVPSGTQLWIQAWMPDASGPAGFVASNAIVGTTP